MKDEELSPEQRRNIEALIADLEAQIARVGVDLRAAMQVMHEIEAPQRSDPSDDGSYTESHTIDLTGIVETLRGLRDGAGTSAFVTAYNRTHSDWRDRA
jgi:hypothetical protein